MIFIDDMDTQMQEIMAKYLLKNHPVERIKVSKRFKRGLMIDGQPFLYTDKSATYAIYAALHKKLHDVFSVGNDDIHYAITSFLKY